jgi:bifunctional DNA-binding transcriptional regulator/antitoxin component of YhaV-PrlF toxin-antitoxin module
VSDRGDVVVPRDILEAAGIGPKSFVRFRVDGKQILVERVSPEGNPLDGPVGKKVDRDLFAKIQSDQKAEKARLLAKFEKGLAEAPKDGDVPPDHPFRYD